MLCTSRFVLKASKAIEAEQAHDFRRDLTTEDCKETPKQYGCS